MITHSDFEEAKRLEQEIERNEIKINNVKDATQFKIGNITFYTSNDLEILNDIKTIILKHLEKRKNNIEAKFNKLIKDDSKSN